MYDELGIPHEYPYFNSGVLLMNLSLLRQTFDSKVLFDFISTHGNNLRFHDQDILNALFNDKVIYVDWHIYNQTILHIKDKFEASTRLADSAVIHYAGPDKPWKYDFKSWYFNLFWKFARRAGYYKLFMQTMWKRFVWRVRNYLK